jgi:hypothetical protein
MCLFCGLRFIVGKNELNGAFAAFLCQKLRRKQIENEILKIN